MQFFLELANRLADLCASSGCVGLAVDAVRNWFC
jgi:hypothetical protein